VAAARRCYNPPVFETVVGVDLGGTNVRAGLYRKDGSSLPGTFSNPSKAQDGVEATVEAIVGTVTEAIAGTESARPLAVGVAVPGHIEPATGTVRWAPNFGEERAGVFHYWRDVPLGDLLSTRLGLPVYLGNDANLAALGEYRYGTGGGSARCLVMLTLGTGVGGGVVLGPSAVGGRAGGPLLLLGGNGGGAELGHMVLQHGGLDCNAGSYGALEAYCGRDGIVNRARHRVQRAGASTLLDLVGRDLSRITPRNLVEAAEGGDALSVEVLEEVGTMLGVGIGNLVNIFAPDVLAVGGQIALAGELLLGPARKSARNVAIPSLFQDVRIVKAELIADAGMLGGAALAWESHDARS
jgi:glucokinase